MKHFWQWVRNEDTGQRSLYLDGVIAQESWFGDEVTPGIFKEELSAGDQPITVHINSIGGDCIAASQIYTMLMDYPAEVTVEIDGVAASAASVIAMAGTKVCMSPTALMMVHNPWTSACGDSGDMLKAIALLDEVKESIINAYQLKTGMSRDGISDLMDQETWMNAYRAQELGFCDEVLFVDEEEPAEKVVFEFSDRRTSVNLMNLVKASLPHEEEASTDLQPEAKADDIGRESDDTACENADVFADDGRNIADAPVNDRVKVLDTDTRLEYLRY